jgi:tRNA nucleotidyltransferase (CCA-adding enzyme)
MSNISVSNSRVLKRQLPLISDSALSRKARAVAEAAQRAGGRALLVGGYVRDASLGLDPKDADIEVYGIEAAALRKLLNRLGRVNCVGESFRVYKLVWHEDDERYELDVSLPRRDRKVGSGHRGFEVEGDPTASVEDAARRRDFTVNAILCDPLSGEIIDPFDGRTDLENRVLRAVDAAHFAEDSLRVLRAMQFAARFEMTVEPQTVELCRSIDLSDLPRERIWGEWEKMLLKSERPSTGLRAAYNLKVLEKLFPYLLEDDVSWGSETKDLALYWRIDQAAQEKVGFSYEKQVTAMLALLCSHFEEEENVRSFLRDLNVHTINGYNVREQTEKLVRECGTPYHLYCAEHHEVSPILPKRKISTGEIRRVALRCDMPLLLFMERISIKGFGQPDPYEWFYEKVRLAGVENGPPTPLLMGRHLLEIGSKPGPRIGEITRAVYEMQLDGDVRTLDEALAAAQRLLNEETNQ